ncbi:hypothetical protein F5X97DRAFT_325162 [Nemania serpens]|nr:hypothetical protein F5X97DRAFT_325162 [Nemania serpens]
MKTLALLSLVPAVAYGQSQATAIARPSVVPSYSCSEGSPFRLQCDHPSMTSYCGSKGNCCYDDGTMQIADNLHCGVDVCNCIHSDACNGFSVVSSTVTVTVAKAR